MFKMRKTENPVVDQDLEQKECSYTVDGNINLYSYFGELFDNIY